MCGVEHVIHKRSLSLLNRLGMMISYSTVTHTLRNSVEAGLAEMREICSYSPVGVVYDNCNIEERVGIETSTNRASQAKLTVGFMYKLHTPGESTYKNAFGFFLLPVLPVLREAVGKHGKQKNTNDFLLMSLTGPLPWELCFKEPSYDVDLFDLLGLNEMGRFWRKEIEALICFILWEQ